MKNTQKDRYYNRLQKCMKEIDSVGYIEGFAKYEEHRDRVLKKYGFTMDDFWRMCRLTESNTKNRFDESVRTYKEKDKIKTDKRMEDEDAQL